jgi:uncharacterized protein
MKIVLDTNVLVSGMLNPDGAPGRIVDMLRSGVVQLVVDDRILAEYRDVLHRDYLSKYFTEFDRESILEFLSSNSSYTTSSVVVLDLPDKGDVPFLETALTEKVPLITGNSRHFPPRCRRGTAVLTPQEFVRKLSEYRE